jgi:hypothetical protein
LDFIINNFSLLRIDSTTITYNQIRDLSTSQILQYNEPLNQSLYRFMKLSSIIQFIIGFLLGIILLAGGTALAAYYLFNKMAENPPRPIYAEEKKEEPKPTPQATPSPSPQPSPAQTPKPSPSPSPSPEKKKELEPGAYKARVTWSSGLSLRDGPGVDSSRVGGVGYNAELIIVQESNDKQWLKVRIPDSGQEGWIKAGNVRKVED